MEKSLWLTCEETMALLEMSAYTYADVDDESGGSALRKLGDLYREFNSEGRGQRMPATRELFPAA